MSLDLVAMRLQDFIEECDEEIADIENIYSDAVAELRATADAQIAEQQAERDRAVAALQALTGQKAHGNAAEPVPSPIVGGEAHPSPPAPNAAEGGDEDAPSAAQPRAVGDPVTTSAGAGDDPPNVPAPPTARTVGAPRKYDYAEVAAFVRRCIAEQWAVLPSLQSEYSTTPGMAKHLLKTARKFDPTLPPLPRGGPAGRGPRSAGQKCAPRVAPKASDRVAKPEAAQVKAPMIAPRDGWALTSPKVEPQPAFIDLEANVLDAPEPPESKGLTYATIAAAYLEDEDRVRMPLQALSDRFGVPRTWANAWVKECRARGLLPPRDQPQRDRVAEVGRRATPHAKVGNW